MKRLHRLFATTLLGSVFAAPVLADTTLLFGSVLAGNGPAANVATLSYAQVGDGDDWQFTLTTSDMASLFSASGAFVSAIAFDAGELQPGGSWRTSMSGVSGDVGQVQLRPGGGPGGSFDFRLVLGGGRDRLGSQQTVSWNWLDSGLSSFAQLALHVQGLGDSTADVSSSLWYSPVAQPVPEAGSQALMTLGLAAMGLLLLRRGRAAER